MDRLGLEQRQQLSQKLSPAQIQAVRLLELPSCELNQCINEELQENPALEEGKDTADEFTEDGLSEWNDDAENERDPLQNEDFNYDEYVQDDEVPEYRTRQDNFSQDEDTREIPFSSGMSFGEYLKRQIYLTKMDKPDRHIAKFVVGNIDEDGYLRRSVEELVDDLAFQEGLSVEDNRMRSIIEEIKQFDPPGVGAKDLQECLLLQLKQKPHTPAVLLAVRVLREAFEDFSKRRFDRLYTRLGVTDEELRAATAEIVKLNPKPGSLWAGTLYDRNQTTVIPDFYVENRDGELRITLNTGDIPELRVSREYRDMLRDYESNVANRTPKMRDAVRFAKSKVDAAQWFIDAIRQRNETLMRTMTAIVEEQRQFFLEGDEANIRPLVLQNIADKTGYDVSTISRVSNSKYVETEFGMYPLKFFFSKKMWNEQGEEISTREIKKILREQIDAEDKSSPLTDDHLVDVMLEHGYRIARRTVAKYREQMGIPVARLRREV